MALDWIGKVRAIPPDSMGGPKAPGNPGPVRVSTTRQGVIPTNTREFGGAWAWGNGLAAFGCPLACASACVGCQYNGAGQCLSGATSRPRETCAGSAIGMRNSKEAARRLFMFIDFIPRTFH